MGHHPRAQALAEVSEDSKKHSIHSDHKHHALALIGVREPEDCSRRKDPDDGIAPQRLELELKITSKNDFFEQSGTNAQQQEESGFQVSMGSKSAQHAESFILLLFQIVQVKDANRHSQDSKQENRNDKKSDGEPNIKQKVLDRIPTAADQVAHAHVAQTNPKSDQKDQEKLCDDCAAVQEHPCARTMDGPKL